MLLRCGASREAVAVTALFLSKPEVVSGIPPHVKAGEGSYHGGRLALLRGCPSRPSELAGMIPTAYYADTWDIFFAWARRGDTRKCIYISFCPLPSSRMLAICGEGMGGLRYHLMLHSIHSTEVGPTIGVVLFHHILGLKAGRVRRRLWWYLCWRSLSVTCLLDNPFICGTSRNIQS